MSEMLNRYPGYVSSASPLLCKDESSQMRKVGLISVELPNKPNRLPLSPLVCHSNFLEGNAGGKKIHITRRSVASVMFDFFRKLHGVQLFSQNTKDGSITKRAAAYLELTKAARAVSDITQVILLTLQNPLQPIQTIPPE